MTTESTDLVRQALEESLDGTLRGLAREAETVMLLIDTSGSMLSRVDYGNVDSPRRIDALRDVVASIKAAGHVPMIAFGGPYDAQVRFVDNVPEPDGGTPLHLAIPMAKQYGATRLVVISDGVPDLQQESLEQARTFGGRIDVSFVGTPGEGGETFMKELARLTGGTQFNGDLGNTKELSGKIILMLEGDIEERKPIEGAGFTSVEPADAPEDEDDDEDEEDEEEEDEDDDE